MSSEETTIRPASETANPSADNTAAKENSQSAATPVTENAGEENTPVSTIWEDQPADGKADGAPEKTGEDTAKADSVEDTAKEGEKKDETSEDEIDYAASLTVPDGFVLEGERMKEACTLFKNNNFSKEQAQSMVDAFCALQKTEAEKQQAASSAAIAQMASIVRSRENFDSELPVAKLGMAKLSAVSPAVAALYKDKVFANMPELFEIALEFGKRFESEGKMLNPSGVSGGENRGPGRMFDDYLKK